MSDKPYPALCRDCKHSRTEENSTWSLRCVNQKVNASDPWALATGGEIAGTNCRCERERWIFAPCGMKGKLWERKDGGR